MPGDARARTICVAALLVAVLLAACTAEPGGRQVDAGATEERPNVLIIVTDDQPIGTLDVMPQTRRYFAEEGVELTNAYGSTPTCCPARASIMTGRFSHNHRVLNNELAHRLDQETTLQARLGSAGYQTALVGKYLNLWKGAPPHFDRWAWKTGARQNRFVDTTWQVDGGQKEKVPGYWTEPFIAHTEATLHDLTDDPQGRPWLLFLTVPAPHAPYVPSPAHRDAELPPWEPNPAARRTARDGKPDYVRASPPDLEEATRIREDQLRSLMAVDEVVAATMDAIGETGAENTLAFFVSDNGYLWGEHGLLGHNLSKGSPYTRSVRVPMLVRWPDRLEGGTTDDRLVAQVDIAPTIYDAAGIDPPPLDGRSLLQDWTRDRMLAEYWKKRGNERSAIPDWAALRTNDFSYVEYYDRGRITFREYYDLGADPDELDNLLGDGDPANDPEVKGLHRKLAADRDCRGESCP